MHIDNKLDDVQWVPFCGLDLAVCVCPPTPSNWFSVNKRTPSKTACSQSSLFQNSRITRGLNNRSWSIHIPLLATSNDLMCSPFSSPSRSNSTIQPYQRQEVRGRLLAFNQIPNLRQPLKAITEMHELTRSNFICLALLSLSNLVQRVCHWNKENENVLPHCLFRFKKKIKWIDFIPLK